MSWIQVKPKRKPNERDSAIEKIAKIRGIEDPQRFLFPSKNELFDPYLIKNVETAANRIIRAISLNEKIVVSFDSDADGLTATSTMIRYLSNYTDNVNYIYGERGDGHGITQMILSNSLNQDTEKERIELNRENIRKIQECDLLILIDSSSNDVAACRHISEKWKKEIIIVDHHEIEVENPYVTMVNIQQKDDIYPNKSISGAGMVFKLLQVMEDTLCQVDPFQYIDLIAVGMYADVMRMDVFENRFIVMEGLRNFKNVGLLRILKSANVDLRRTNSNTIGFTIAPLINGCARMENIKLAIDMLLTDDDAEAMKLNREMKKLNDDRKIRQKEITDRYAKNINEDEKILIVIDENSSKGFNGLICQQLSEQFKRPAIVGRLHKGKLSGSFRSYNGFNLKEFLVKSELIDEAMGHPQAGGIVVDESNIAKLNKYIDENLPVLEDRQRNFFYDFEINVKEVNKYVDAIEEYNKVTGNGFYRITVKVSGLTVADVKCIGKTMETVKIETMDDLECIRFRVDETYASELGFYDEIDVVGALGKNYWYNFQERKEIIKNQIMIDDYQMSN